jgi:hypothetical protein
MFRPDITCLLLSRKQKLAEGLLVRVKFILKHLPEWMRPKVVAQNKSEIVFRFVFRGNVGESNVLSLTTTDDSGRGEDAAVVLMDEAAFMQNADDVWSAIGPTAAFGGQRAVISTPNGVGGLFHRLVSESRLGVDNGFTYLEAHWKRDCGLSDEWYVRATRGMGLLKKQQEFGLVFLSSGRPFFDLNALNRCYKPTSRFPEIASAMCKTAMNFGGVDTSEGHTLADGGQPDFHSITILNQYGVQIYQYSNNKISQREFSGYTERLPDGQAVEVESVPSKIHREYPGMMAIERWGSGDITYAHHQVPLDGRSNVVARRQTNSSKMSGLNALRRMINDDAIVITDQFTYHCCTTFEDQTSGIVQKAAASKGSFDDPVITLMLAAREWERWGGYQFDLTSIGQTSGGQRAVGLRQQSDMAQGDLAKLLPVGTIAQGPLWQEREPFEPGEGNRRYSDDIDLVRRGKKMRPTGL